ncbi:hypothetical protein [Virgibacillus sp. MG-45]|uniref:hypothetical protein n=1 Tax=Virgibacillus sp. MG-45 TaxID=3102791 RepID=UPI002EDB7116
MDFIMDNIVIIALIVGGLLKFFGDSTSKEDQRKESSNPTRNPRPAQSPRPVPTASERGRTVPPSVEVQKQHAEQEMVTVQPASIKEQQQQQLERLANRVNTTMDHSMQHINKQHTGKQKMNGMKQQHQNSHYSIHKRKKQMENRLTSRGLVDSVIMAEVLGAPRAKKPYRNIITDRNNR